MGNSITLPNGQQLTSSALSPDAMLQLFQQLTAGMLGLNPQSATDVAYASVRVDWPTAGAPAFLISDNVTFLSATEIDHEYDTRDRAQSANDATSVLTTFTYNRRWRVQWRAYGPNSFDNARIVNDCFYLGYSHDVLAASNVYFISSGRPLYTPELFAGQWWKRTDLSATFYEGVTATIIDPTISSAEVLVSTEQAQVADVQIS